LTTDTQPPDGTGQEEALPVSIPILTTERLILRPHRLDDFEAVTALWSDPEVVRFIGGVPSTREQSWSRLLRYKGSWHLLGFGFWAIEERTSGRFIGEAGFLEARRDITPSIEGTLETGWVLDPSAHGKGYAAEALKAMIEWGQMNFPGRTMTCIVHPENAASLRLAAKLGFRETARADYNGEIILLSR
jgi:RimJ/RimL family protein N-acetyltransferase